MRGIVVVVAALAGCIKTNAVTCGDGHVCAPDHVCDEIHETCVFPDQLETCKGLADGTACTIRGMPGGTCKDMVCIPATCGDELTTGDEVCDGAGDIPAVGTCVDFAYDYGPLGCDALCTEGFESCGRLGWQWRSLTGVGQIGGIWEDGADLWLANQMGIYRRHAGAWDPLIQPAGGAVWYHGIWAGGGHAFAVGNDGTVAHYDGTTWTVEQLTAGGALYGVWGRGSDDVFAVGGKSIGAIWHFNGTAWSPMTVPSPPPLFGIGGTETAVFAVGASGTILRLGATGWTDVGPDTANAYTLRSVWGSSDRAFAVGSSTTDPPAAIALQFDGLAWNAMQLPPGTLELTEVSGRSLTEVYAVGARNGSNILFYDGNGWTPMVTDVQGTILSLQSVHAGQAGVYAAKRPNTFLEYAGAGWLEKASAQETVRSIWGGSRDFAIAIGDGLFYQLWEKNQWLSYGYPICYQTPFAFAVWGSSLNDIWIVGPYGQMIHKTSTTVTCEVSGNNKWLADIWGFAANDIYAVGANDTNTEANLIHFNGSSWQDLSDRVMPFVKKLGHVWGSGPGDVYVTGENKLLHFNGTTWSDTGLVTTHELTAIWGSSASDVYVVGSAGAIFHYDGTTWSQVFVPVGLSTPTNPTWTDIHGSGPNDIYVVGSRTLLHFDGTSWWPISRLAPTSVEAVWATTNAVITAGEAGIDARLVGRLR